MARLIAVENAADPRLEAYRAIRERDLVGRQGLFVAEGEVVLRMLAGAPGLAIRSCLIAENRLAAVADCLDRLSETIDAYVAPRAVLAEVAGFDIHRGVLAIGARPEPESAEALLAGLPERVVVLVALGIANHDNMGGLFRNAAAFGVGAVLLDHQSCDPLYRKAIRVSAGGVFRVPFIRAAASAEADPFRSMLEARGFARVALSPGAPAPLHAYRRPARVALYVGAEGPGLSAAAMDGSTVLSIPMEEGVDSLNVAVSAGIALHHLTRVAASS